MASKRLVASVAVHLFEVVEDGKRRYEIDPLIFIEREGEDFRQTARALRSVAKNIDDQASPILVPAGLGN